jgi:hypothetical protein
MENSRQVAAQTGEHNFQFQRRYNRSMANGFMIAREVRRTEDGIPMVQCPACEHVNGFPDLDTVLAFVCHYCGQPVEVREDSSDQDSIEPTDQTDAA